MPMTPTAAEKAAATNASVPAAVANGEYCGFASRETPQ